MTDPCAWLVAHASSCLELAGFVSGALCVWLVTRESIWNWPLGAITAAAYIVVFARAGLYSDTGLQAVYLVLSFYGWWHWWRGARRDAAANAGSRGAGAAGAAGAAPVREPLVVTRVPVREAVLLGVAGLVMWLTFWAITARLPGSRAPLLDSALVATSLVAQYMMTRKYLENWTLWIIADVLYIGLYFTRDLRLTSLLYAVYLALAVLGHVQWKRSWQRSLARVAVP